MSDPALHDVLTPERLAYLRMLLSGDKRDDDDMPFSRNRSRERWLASHGYIKWGPRPPAVTAKKKLTRRETPVRRVEVTDLGRRAVEAAERKTT